jgi:hypothetical protein
MVPRLASGLFLAAALMALPSLAHHSYAAYDLNHTLTLKGTVESFHWSNPHSTFTPSVNDAWNAASSQSSIHSAVRRLTPQRSSIAPYRHTVKSNYLR